MTLGEILHPQANVWLRPEFGRLSHEWPVMAFRNHATLVELGDQYQRGRDIIISTGIIDELTRPEYQSRLLAAVICEPKQDIPTRRIVPPASLARHVARWGKEKWPHCFPLLCIYHFVSVPQAGANSLPHAHAVIPHHYNQLDYRSGSGRSVGGALLVEGQERKAVMKLALQRQVFTPCAEVTDFQNLLRTNGIQTYACP
jgi:hypothetical protein